MQKNAITLVLAAISCIATATADQTKPRVLILSGANNHNWRETTPVIKATLEETGKFLVDVEENVGTMKPDAFAPYAVILSNYNTFGKDAPKETWGAETKQAFLDHIAKGNGLVIMHAGSSVFYDWPEFQALACGTWKDGTSHGQIHISRVDFTDEKHPVTEGLAPFWIRDEFWEKILVAPGAKNSCHGHPRSRVQGQRQAGKNPLRHRDRRRPRLRVVPRPRHHHHAEHRLENPDPARHRVGRHRQGDHPARHRLACHQGGCRANGENPTLNPNSTYHIS
jgi:uncharacterized protein